MGIHRRHLIQDAILLSISIAFAVFISKTGLVVDFLVVFGDSQTIGVIVAGMLFTSLFTTPPAIARLSVLALRVPLAQLALLGGLGAMMGDYVLFRFVRDRISEDFRYLLSKPRRGRFAHIFKGHLFKFFVPFIGALIIASPLPDELGVTIMGLSKVRSRYFFVLSLVANIFGVFVIGWIARSAAGL